MKAVIGLLLLLAVTLVSACSSEPTPEPTAAPSMETPVSAADAGAPEPAATPEPTSTPTPAPTPAPTQVPAPALSLDVTLDTTWAQVITALPAWERDCIRNAVDRRALADLSQSRIVWPDDDDLAEEWTPVIFNCLAPDTARAVYASMVLAFMEPGLSEAGITLAAEHRLCAQEEISDVDVAAILVDEDDEAGMDAWGRIFDCFPVYMAANLVGMPEMAVYLDDDELACVREWHEDIDWDTVWESEGGPGFMSILPGLADCSPDLVLGMVLQESGTWVTFWDLDDEELDCLREGMTALDWATIPPGEEEGMAALADAVKLSQCVSTDEIVREAPQEPPKSSAADDESLLWHFPTKDPVAGAPTVFDGVLYFSSEDHHVYALDAATGDQLWKFETGDVVWSTPTVTDDAVYFGSDDEYVYALDRKTGELLWEHHTRDWVEYSVPASEGVVYIKSGTYEKREIQARDGTTGDLLWAVEMPETKRPPEAIGANVYVLSSGKSADEFHALDASTGERLWVLNIEDVEYPPAVTGGIVYFTGWDTVYAADEATGDILWSYEAEEGPTNSSPVVEDGICYFAPEGRFYALDAETGQVLWSYSDDYPIPMTPTVADGLVYVATYKTEQFHALDAATGETVWSRGMLDDDLRSLAVVDGVLYAEGWDGLLWALEASSGEELWEFYNEEGNLPDGPSYTVADGVVYVGSTARYDSGVYAFTAPSPGG